MSIRILLADDHRIMRQGLRALIEAEAGMEVVAEADNGRVAVHLAEELKPDIVVMDVAMPDLNGIEATGRIVKGGGVKVIGLSVHADRQFVTRMLEAGASGYLLKDCAFEELATAIRTVTANKTYLSPQVAGVVVSSYLRSARTGPASHAEALTAREREVLQLIAEGKTTKELARRLSVSVKTAETHRRNIMAKLKVHSIAQLTKYALREGLTSLDQ